jgi:hypothetical protein
MNKKFLLFILLSSTILLQANQRRATCDNAQPPLTEEEHATCIRIEEFMLDASKLYSKGHLKGWRSHQQFGLTQWNLALKETPLSATSAKHIEAVLCDAGFETMWRSSHSWNKALEHVMWNEVYPSIINYGKSAVITVTGVAAGASIFMHKATVVTEINGVKTTLTIPASTRTTTYPGLPPITDSVHEDSLIGATWSALSGWFPSTQGVVFTLTIGAAYIGGQVYYKIHEELPFMYFKTSKEVEEYLETLDRIA